MALLTKAKFDNPGLGKQVIKLVDYFLSSRQIAGVVRMESIVVGNNLACGDV